MAKKRLFGNHSEPRCATCALGKLSSDGETVLCRNGAVPPDHHCRRFRYDPLKRIPRRARPLGEYDASDFALDEPQTTEEWIDAISKDSYDDLHARLVKKLQDYLNETSTPDVQTILSILSKESNSTTMETAALLAEAETFENSDDSPPENAVMPDDTSVPSEPPPSEDDTPAEAIPELLLDDSPDIVGDLERLTVSVSESSTIAAFRNATIHIVDTKDDEDSDTLGYEDNAASPMLTLPSNGASDEELPLSANDLILLPDIDWNEEVVEAIRMNDDGSFTTYTE